MAEGFATASAAVGVAAAAGQLIDGILKLRAFCLELREVPEDIQNAVDDLASLIDVLECVQLEISQDSFVQAFNVGISRKLLASLEQSSQYVGEVLHEMQAKLEKKMRWGRVKVIGLKKKLEKSALRAQNAQNLLLITLATDNR